MSDPFNLQRFVEAQKPIYPDVLTELRNGRKQTHWMWFVFPQIHGLGRSSTAIYYSISSRSEADCYLAHPILGPRLLECTSLVNAIPDRTVEQIFGGIDATKFRSSMTLFSLVATQPEPFSQALEKYFGGQTDSLTISQLA